VDPTPPGEDYLKDLAFAARYPLLEWLARKCVAAVAHSGHYVDRLRAACPGRVETIPLAMRFPSLPPPPAPWEILTIAVIGHANPNKRIDRLILGVGASAKLRARCRIRIIGETTPDMRLALERIAAVAGVAPLQFTGWIPDDDLARSLRDVDAICCLRNPVLEGASASLLLAMSSGRPTLVTNHGCYAEAPEDAVLRCAPDHEARDVARHLGRLLDDPTRGAETGKRARAHVCGRLGPVAYVDALLPLVEQAIADRPRFAARRSLVDTLASFGLGRADAACARIDSTLESLAGSR
jgi:glycosyltransferase involved in cell wall biosynthesis